MNITKFADMDDDEFDNYGGFIPDLDLILE